MHADYQMSTIGVLANIEDAKQLVRLLLCDGHGVQV